MFKLQHLQEIVQVVIHHNQTNLKFTQLSGKTINDAISIFDNYLSKKLNFTHTTAIIFSEEIAKEGVNFYLNFFINNSQIRPTCKVLISSDTAVSALENVTSSEETFSAKLYEFIIDSADYTGYSVNPKLTDFYYNINSDFGSSVTTYAVITDKMLQDIGIAVFKGDKLICNLEVLDSIAYSLINNSITNCTVTIPNPREENEYIDVLVSPRKKSKITVNIVNNVPNIKINGYFNLAVQSINTSVNYSSPESIKEIENATKAYLEQITYDFLYRITRQYNVDICNFKNIASSNYLTLDDFRQSKLERDLL